MTSVARLKKTWDKGTLVKTFKTASAWATLRESRKALSHLKRFIM